MNKQINKHYHAISWPSQHFKTQIDHVELQRFIRLEVEEHSYLNGPVLEHRGLIDNKIAAIIEEVLFSLDTQYYYLIAWTIVENAVYALIELNSVYLICHVVDTWKSFMLKLIRERSIACIPMWASGYNVELCTGQSDIQKYYDVISKSALNPCNNASGPLYQWSSERYRP
ncbi:MAG: hypothetical protein HRU15_06675 [Planctomycetes bacterium]|nr:hypothetical protein [Planctomycetota bacterium]